MTHTRRSRPVAVCTKCGAYSYRAESINEQCSMKPDGKRCRGVYGSALNVADWKECPACTATGCDRCNGAGWIYVRGLG